MEYWEITLIPAPSSGEISQSDWHQLFVIQLLHSISLCEPLQIWGYLVPEDTDSQSLKWNLCMAVKQYELAPDQAWAQRHPHHITQSTEHRGQMIALDTDDRWS